MHFLAHLLRLALSTSGLRVDGFDYFKFGEFRRRMITASVSSDVGQGQALLAGVLVSVQVWYGKLGSDSFDSNGPG